MQLTSIKVFAVLLLVAPTCINAARKSKGLKTQARARAEAEAASKAATENTAEVVVELVRVPARKVNGMDSHASFYVGNMTVGNPPQEFQVLFDTGSGHVLLPHKACKTAVCLEHHQYSPWASSTAVDVNDNGEAVQKDHRLAEGKVNRSFASLEFTQSDLGEGVAKGVLVRDHVCLSSGPAGHRGHQACTDLAMLTATDEDAMPFTAMPADGIVGLGLEGLAVSALSSFYAGLMDSTHNLLPEFGILLNENGGKIIFGGRAAIASLAAPLEWFQVSKPEDGVWQVNVLSVRVAGTVVDACEQSCHAVVDTSSSRLGIQDKDDLANLRSSLITTSEDGHCQGPELQFELPRGLVLTLSAAEYADEKCETQIGSLNLDGPTFKGVYSLGTNVLRRYYAAFDWATAQVGFAPNAGSHPLHHLRRSARQEVDSITV